MSGRGMNAAGTAFKCNVVAHNYNRFAVKEGVVNRNKFKVFAFYGCNNLVVFNFGFGKCRGGKPLRHNKVFVAGFDNIVIKIGAKANGNVTGQCPGSGSPYYKEYLVFINTKFFKNAFIVKGLKLNVDRVANVVRILDFGFREGGLALGAPINRL